MTDQRACTPFICNSNRSDNPLEAHTVPTKLRFYEYFCYSVTKKIWFPLVLTFISNVIALVVAWYGSEQTLALQREVFAIVQDTLFRTYLSSFLGFFTGFSLNNAFQRYTKGLDFVQQLSVHLRSGADQLLNSLGKYKASRSPEKVRHAEQVIAWVKVYFIQACRGLNSVTLRNQKIQLDETMIKWEGLLDEQVELSEACLAAVSAHCDVFMSTLQMELLWWRWLAPVLHMDSSDSIETSQAKKSFEAARKSFHLAHLLASGINAPITKRLLEAVMYLFCLVNPWCTTLTFGAWSFISTFFITYVFFGALQISDDLWQPYGVDAPGVADVELFLRARALCKQLDQMLSLFSDGYYAPLDMTGEKHFSLVDAPFSTDMPKDPSDDDNTIILRHGSLFRSESIC